MNSFALNLSGETNLVSRNLNQIMFTGIIETLGEVVSFENRGYNSTFGLTSSITSELKVDQSLSHNGVCLTVTRIEGGTYYVTAVEETLYKTTLGSLTTGSKVNLERCMPANGRFDGHIVQGHVDQRGICTSIEERGGSWLYDFAFDPNQGNIVVEKGSICINGVSLTVFNTKPNSFRVAIIPYTYEHTNFHKLKVGEAVNLEFDILGKYIQRIMKP